MKRTMLLPLLLPLAVLAQSNDTSFVTAAINHTKEIHTHKIVGESLLFNGVDYVKYIPLHDEYPYFLSDDFLSASISYDNQQYKNIWLLYNISTDNVIIENYNFSNTIQLIKDRIQFFKIEGHTFVHINHPSLAQGFYELLYDGETRVLAKHTKKFQEEIKSGELLFIFEKKTRYYIFKNNQYHQVYSKASVLNVFREHKHDLARLFRKSAYQFKSDRPAGIVTLAQAYDSITR